MYFPKFVPFEKTLWKWVPSVIFAPIFPTEVRYLSTHSHASLHRPTLVGLTYECCPLAPVQLKGFVPWAAAFKDANQHYLLRRKTRVKRIHSFIHWTRQQQTHSSEKTDFTSLCQRKHIFVRMLRWNVKPLDSHYTAFTVSTVVTWLTAVIRFYRPCWYCMVSVIAIILAP